jgi:hypothetical protein
MTAPLNVSSLHTSPMTGHRFPDGGYVGHGLRVNANVSPMRFSVWFSADGKLLDCEAFDNTGRSRPVSPRLRKILASMFGWVVAVANRKATP